MSERERQLDAIRGNMLQRFEETCEKLNDLFRSLGPAFDDMRLALIHTARVELDQDDTRVTTAQAKQVVKLAALNYLALLLSLPAGYRLLSLAERPTNDMLYKPKHVDPRAPWCDPSNESQMLRQIDVDEHCRYWFAVRYGER